jgi:hypothetical protein
MPKFSSRVQLFFLQCIAPIVCSIVLGYVLYQEHVFDRHYGAFQFVWTAIVASTFYYLLTGARLRDALAGLVGLFILTFFTTESTHAAFILRDIFYFAAIAGSVYVYFRYFRRHHVASLFYIPFMFAGIYGSLYVVSSEVHLAILSALNMETTGGNTLSIAEVTAFFGVLIGFPLGLGIEINERWLFRSDR